MLGRAPLSHQQALLQVEGLGDWPGSCLECGHLGGLGGGRAAAREPSPGSSLLTLDPACSLKNTFAEAPFAEARAALFLFTKYQRAIRN